MKFVSRYNFIFRDTLFSFLVVHHITHMIAFDLNCSSSRVELYL